MIIRLSEASDRDVILPFIAEMGFNPRDAATWDGLNMLAMTAWDGSQLIGAIPLEPRVLQTGGESYVKTVHETVVAVRPQWRGQHVGSQLQQAILEARPGKAELATVFREEPASAAHRWYRQNGFAVIANVQSWFADLSGQIEIGAEFELVASTDIGEQWIAIEALRCAHLGATAGLLGRSGRPLRGWLPAHPYHSRYAFHLVMRWRDGALAGYALLGVGKMHSETLRADVLEFCPGHLEADSDRTLIGCVLEAARRNDWRPVRWPLATTDPSTCIADAMGFKAQWGFDMMARALTPAAGRMLETAAISQAWGYAGIDYA